MTESCHPRVFDVPVAPAVALRVAELGQGAPVLLLHGFPDNGGLWLPLAARLAVRHRVWMPDLRGYRHSAKPAAVHDYAIGALLDDVHALVQQLGRGAPVVLAGHDWGGMLAWALAATRPALVQHLVIFNAPHPCRFAELLRTDAAQRDASAYVQRLAAPDAQAALSADGYARMRALLRHALPGLPAAELEALAAGWAMPGALTAMLNWYRALDLRHPHAVPSLGTASGHIEAPTLLLWGERDGAFVPANLEGLQRWVPRLTLRRFADAGHWLPREEPDAAADAMLEFIAGTPAHPAHHHPP